MIYQTPRENELANQAEEHFKTLYFSGRSMADIEFILGEMKLRVDYQVKNNTIAGLSNGKLVEFKYE